VTARIAGALHKKLAQAIWDFEEVLIASDAKKSSE
jgi:hypothetical protein